MARTLPRPLPLTAVRLTGGFWKQRQDVNTRATLPIQHLQCSTTGRIDAFRLKWKPMSKLPQPHIFWDSDVAKWIEAASYSLVTHPDRKLEKQLDDVIGLIAKSQQADGYLNSHYTVVEPNKRWTNLRDNHELYCAGHLIEAAVAHFQATGKRSLLEVMCRYVDHIAATFGRGPGQKPGYCGHEEIELSLIKLYGVTGERRHLALAEYFIDERGAQPHYFTTEAKARGDIPDKWYGHTYAYCQAHKPVREQTEVVGHAVRAMYLYSAMADLAAINGDKALLSACHRLWDNLIHRKLYVTGGIGPSAHNEGFTTDFDLPNLSAYAETCAAIGLVFWAHRLLHIDMDSRFADVMETCLYNGTISGVSLDGKKFFYVNPLESRGVHHRQEWFGCACCPPNIARMVAALGQYAYSSSDNALYVHLYGESEAEATIDGIPIQITQATKYPWDGRVELRLKFAGPDWRAFTLGLRIPSWCRAAKLAVNGKSINFKPIMRKGYALLRREWKSGDRVTLDLPMPVERIEAKPEVAPDCGRVALRRGPMVYCLEETDNGGKLNDLALDDSAKLTTRFVPGLLEGVTVIEGRAKRRAATPKFDGLYRRLQSRSEAVRFRAVPYFAWDNRKAGEMLVWLRRS